MAGKKYKTPGKGGLRFYKNVGLGFRTPKEAIEGAYIDKKCPFTGNVSIRGRILSGIVKSAKMKNTIIVRMNYFHYIKKYQRYGFPFRPSTLYQLEQNLSSLISFPSPFIFSQIRKEAHEYSSSFISLLPCPRR